MHPLHTAAVDELWRVTEGVDAVKMLLSLAIPPLAALRHLAATIC